MIGKRFGLVTVLRRADEPATRMGTIMCFVRCECGAERWMRSNNFKSEPPKTHLRCTEEGKTNV